jgi:hypothetical protein
MKILMIVSGATCFLLAVIYLFSMGRIASHMQRAGIKGVSLADPNGQVGLIKAVFRKGEMDAGFYDSHRFLVGMARVSGAIGFSLLVMIFVAILKGYFH